MKMYKAPTVETVELDVVDVITVSGGGAKGIDTASYGFSSTTSDGTTAITNSNKGGEWQDNWN